ncbi:amidohydrolase [Kineococcus sp. NUM-3379]
MSDAPAPAPAAVRRLYRGGSVYSPADPFATAMLVTGDHIAWVGPEEAAAAHAADADEVVDLQGSLITPAFVDAHVHTTETGLALTGLELSGCPGPSALLDAVAAAAARSPGAPVLGHGWDETTWGAGPPTAEQIGRAAGGAEVYLSRADVHSALVSPALAARAGLSALPGWHGSGWIRTQAHHAARDATRSALGPARERAQRAALRAAAAAGIATVHEMSGPHIAGAGDLAALVSLAADPAGRFPAVVPYAGLLAQDAASARALVASARAEGVELAGLAGDLCVDGAYGSRTAALREPYADEAGNRGVLHLDREQVRDHLTACAGAGVQAGFHVIGDAALDVVLAALLEAEERLGAPALAAAGVRLEHLCAVDGAAVATLARLGVGASVQPAFDATWGAPGGTYEQRLGSGRARALHPFSALAAAGVPLALGSDSPVTPFSPWAAVRAAAFPTTSGHGISVRAAFLAHTRGGHRLARRPEQPGVLVPGAPATYAVWEAQELVVQVPDARVAAWSTDARSGTPGLPDLAPGRDLPRCRRTVRGGVLLHDAW